MGMRQMNILLFARLNMRLAWTMYRTLTSCACLVPNLHTDQTYPEFEDDWILRIKAGGMEVRELRNLKKYRAPHRCFWYRNMRKTKQQTEDALTRQLE